MFGRDSGGADPLLLELDVTQMVEDLETGRRLSAAAQRVGGPLRVHVKLDTGMSRAGLLWEAGRGGGDGGRDRPAVPPARSGGRGPVYPLCGRRRERGLYYGPV